MGLRSLIKGSSRRLRRARSATRTGQQTGSRLEDIARTHPKYGSADASWERAPHTTKRGRRGLARVEKAGFKEFSYKKQYTPLPKDYFEYNEAPLKLKNLYSRMLESNGAVNPIQSTMKGSAATPMASPLTYSKGGRVMGGQAPIPASGLSPTKSLAEMGAAQRMGEFSVLPGGLGPNVGKHFSTTNRMRRSFSKASERTKDHLSRNKYKYMGGAAAGAGLAGLAGYSALTSPTLSEATLRERLSFERERRGLRR